MTGDRRQETGAPASEIKKKLTLKKVSSYRCGPSDNAVFMPLW